ncbi:MAG: DUF3788 family protein [Candidatus Aminicenantes bacterium]|nr:DUF3788 family protein [Candidatus Aminicenantes bacterium]
MTAPNAFIGRAKKPTERELSAVLGPAQALWDELLAAMAAEFGLKAREWSSYSIKAGWSLRLKQGERNILYLIPSAGEFSVSLVLGDKAVAAAKKAGLPAAILELIAGARRYAEGTGIRFEMKSPDDIAVVKALTALKLG